jgi:sugar/nucleoside kinase (ribokinase family)
VKRRFDRLLHLGNVVVDVVLDVPDLPERGDDVLASATQVTPGGGYNVMAAAVARGLPAGYAGAHGSGPFAALARAALARAGIEVLQEPKAGADTGFVVAIVDAAGERTFLTSRGAEATLTAEDLKGVRATPRDAVYLSGYGLVYPSNASAILGWLGRLGEPNLVFLDPGPLVGAVPGDVLRRVLRRADWLTCNAREAAGLTGLDDPSAAALALARGAVAGVPGVASDGQDPAHPREGVLVRAGAAGCLVARAGAGSEARSGAGADGLPPVHVPGFPVTVLDTNGAGDTHAGTFIAALAAGADALDAARTANAAAALSVTRRGPATAPADSELARFLAGR